MSIATYFENLWRAAIWAPRPDSVRNQLLVEAQLELMQSEQAAEDYAVQSVAYREKSRVLRARIERLKENNNGYTEDIDRTGD